MLIVLFLKISKQPVISRYFSSPRHQ